MEALVNRLKHLDLPSLIDDSAYMMTTKRQTAGVMEVGVGKPASARGFVLLFPRATPYRAIRRTLPGKMRRPSGTASYQVALRRSFDDDARIVASSVPAGHRPASPGP